MLYKTLGIVLRYFNFGEANKIVTFYSSRFGKIKAVVKGVRKTKSKFGSSMELFTNNNLLLYHKENRDLYLVTQSSIVDSFRELREDLNKLYKSAYVVEVVDLLTKGTEKNQAIFDLLISIFSLLRSLNSKCELEKILRLFEIKFLSILGYKLKLDRCSFCNKEFNRDEYFISPKSIGILCKNCTINYYKNSFYYSVTSDSIKIIKSMQNIEIEDIQKLKLYQFTEQNQTELKRILQDFIRFYTEKEINSLKFM